MSSVIHIFDHSLGVSNINPLRGQSYSSSLVGLPAQVTLPTEYCSDDAFKQSRKHAPPTSSLFPPGQIRTAFRCSSVREWEKRAGKSKTTVTTRNPSLHLGGSCMEEATKPPLQVIVHLRTQVKPWRCNNGRAVPRYRPADLEADHRRASRLCMRRYCTTARNTTDCCASHSRPQLGNAKRGELVWGLKQSGEEGVQC
jgi:hypothetical protein